MADIPTTPIGPSGMTSLNVQSVPIAQEQPATTTLAAQIADKIKANSLNGETDDLTSFETKKKVDGLKQKIYVLALAIVAYFIYTYIDTAFNTYNANAEVLVKVQGDIRASQSSIDTFKSQAEVLKQITRESDVANLITCINNSNLCDNVLTGIKKNLEVTRSYLLLTPLSGDKMDIDQKSLLRYFNEYLLVGESGPLGQLLNITFSDPSVVDQAKQIYQISVDTTISFPGKDAMMEMIQKIETGLDPSNMLLIKISDINYNIVRFEEPQTVNVSFIIYHYKK